MSTAVFTKNVTPVPPAAGDVRVFVNNSGIWCSEDEYGNVIVYAGATAMPKAGVVSSGSFSGNPKTASVIFATAFSDNNYAVNITGIDNRNWTAETLTASGFTINANANQTLIGQVFWSATHSGG